jgi:hypothetical protein
MTEYGKHGKPRSRLSTLPTLLGNPFEITTFPQPRFLAYFRVQEHERPNPRPLDLKGVVIKVLGVVGEIAWLQKLCRFQVFLPT